MLLWSHANACSRERFKFAKDSFLWILAFSQNNQNKTLKKLTRRSVCVVEALQARPGGPQLSVRSKELLTHSIDQFKAVSEKVKARRITIGDFQLLQQHKDSMLTLCGQLGENKKELTDAFIKRQKEAKTFSEFTRLFSEMWILCKAHLKGKADLQSKI